jgi:hypothetical protein
MRMIASIALSIAGLAAAAAPGLADDKSIGQAAGLIGAAPAWAYDQQTQTTWRPYGWVQPAAPSSYGTYAQYRDSAQSGGYAQKGCTYNGGPKIGSGWTCQ